MLLTLFVIYNWSTVLIDVETAFLYRDLEEDIYMKLSPGFFPLDENIKVIQEFLGTKLTIPNANKKVCLKINYALYRLVQVARASGTKFAQALVSINFNYGKVHLCLLYWKKELGMERLILYVDSRLLMGDEQAIESGIQYIKKLFKLKLLLLEKQINI